MTASLREIIWPRFLRAPDGQVAAKLYEPALRRAVRYDRSCAYFSSSVLAAAAAGFGAFIQRIIDREVTDKPALRLLVNEELAEADVQALLEAANEAPLIDVLLARLGTPEAALQKARLEMLAWLTREGWLTMKVGVMRQGQGIAHAKFGLFVDASSDAVVFGGSSNETAHGLQINYDELEISGNWTDAERHDHYRARFDALWANEDPAVAVVPLPEAVRDELIKFAPDEAPVAEPTAERARQTAAMLWSYALAAPFMPDGGAATCDAMAPVTMWPHQNHVVSETAAAWPDGRLLCDEVGMGKTVEAILVLRRLLAGRGVRRALILPPANLLSQWQGELREKGGLRVPFLSGSNTLNWPDGSKQAVAGMEQALEQDLLLISRETARTEGNLPILLAARPWDIVLLDEGHAARRASQKEGEFNASTLLLGLLRRLQATGQARSIMILSATPMQTDPWEPWDLLQVLGEGGVWLSGFHVVERFYKAMDDLERGQLTRREAEAVARVLAETPGHPAAPDDLALPPVEDTEAVAKALRFMPAVQRSKAAGWLRSCSPLSRRMHRNTRRTLRRYHEMGLLDRAPAERDVREDPFDFATTEEREVYDAVEAYIDRRFDELEGQRPGKGFVMTIYRRRAASSPAALRKSLVRRATNLKAVIAQRAFDDTILDLDDDQELQDLMSMKLTSAMPDTPEEAIAELSEVESLISRIDALGGLDTKRDRLVAWAKSLTADGRSVLIFTGYADTMQYLRESLVGAFGDGVASYSGEGGAFHAPGGWLTVTKEQVTSALQAGSIKVLVCTDAASEGLNLQAAGALVNFDLPWNPSKVEQRIGRVDRIGQQQPVLPIVNMFLQDSVDERVYRALAMRCGLFETFVGPMQPVLSLALRMLIGRDHVNEAALAAVAEAIRNNPSLMQAFVEDDVVVPPVEPGLLEQPYADVLLSALNGTGISVTAETNVRHRIGRGSLRIVTHPSGVATHPDATCIDGLDDRQWQLLRQLQQPGERLPLVTGAAERGAFRVILSGWVTADGVQEINSFADLRARVEAWDGNDAPNGTWQAARAGLVARAHEIVTALATRRAMLSAASREAQISAARLRLVDELGKTLVCFDPDTDDLNGKFHRLMTERTQTAERMQRVFQRLGDYPEWDGFQLADLRDYREHLTPNQIKTRLTGRELDAALADPRWAMRPSVE